MQLGGAPLGPYSVGLTELKDLYAGSTNAGIVTVTGVSTSITTVALTGLAVGDLLLVNWQVDMIKGATGGQSLITLAKSAGSAVVDRWYPGGLGVPASLMVAGNIAAGLEYLWSGALLLFVSTAGDLTLNLAAVSAGSDSTVAAGFGKLGTMILKL